MKILFILALLLSGCSVPKPEIGFQRVIPAKNADKAAKFIVDCAEAATPHSTGEDQSLPVDPCKKAALEVYGVTVEGTFYRKCSDCYPEFVPKQ